MLNLTTFQSLGENWISIFSETLTPKIVDQNLVYTCWITSPLRQFVTKYYNYKVTSRGVIFITATALCFVATKNYEKVFCSPPITWLIEGVIGKRIGFGNLRLFGAKLFVTVVGVALGTIPYIRYINRFNGEFLLAPFLGQATLGFVVGNVLAHGTIYQAIATSPIETLLPTSRLRDKTEIMARIKDITDVMVVNCKDTQLQMVNPYDTPADCLVPGQGFANQKKCFSPKNFKRDVPLKDPSCQIDLTLKDVVTLNDVLGIGGTRDHGDHTELPTQIRSNSQGQKARSSKGKTVTYLEKFADTEPVPENESWERKIRLDKNIPKQAINKVEN